MRRIMLVMAALFVGILALSGFSAAALNRNGTTGYVSISDTTPPEIDVTWETYKVDGEWYVDINAEAYDEESGIEKFEMYVNNELMDIVEGPGPYGIAFTCKLYEAKTSVFKFVAYNGAGLSTEVLIEGSDISIQQNIQKTTLIAT